MGADKNVLYWHASHQKLNFFLEYGLREGAQLGPGHMGMFIVHPPAVLQLKIALFPRKNNVRKLLFSRLFLALKHHGKMQSGKEKNELFPASWF